MTEQIELIRKQQLRLAPLAITIWIIISAVGFWLIPQLLDSSMLVFASFFGGTSYLYGRDYWGGTFLRSVIAVILGVLLLAVMIGSAEYYFRNLGKPGSWTAFARIIAVEISLIVLTVIL